MQGFWGSPPPRLRYVLNPLQISWPLQFACGFIMCDYDQHASVGGQSQQKIH